MSTITATSEAIPGVIFPPLTHSDRSDAYASGAVQALVRVVKGSQDLILDGHSFHKHEAELMADGWTVRDDNREHSHNKPVAAY